MEQKQIIKMNEEVKLLKQEHIEVKVNSKLESTEMAKLDNVTLQNT